MWAHIHPYTQIYASKGLHALCKATVTEKPFLGSGKKNPHS